MKKLSNIALVVTVVLLTFSMVWVFLAPPLLVSDSPARIESTTPKQVIESTTTKLPTVVPTDKPLKKVPTRIPTRIPTNIPPTPTELAAIGAAAHAGQNLTVFQQPDFNSMAVYTLATGSEVLWLDKGKDFSTDPAWNWYHIQYKNSAQPNTKLEGYVVVMTSQGKLENQASCAMELFDAYTVMAKKTSQSIQFPGIHLIAANGFDVAEYVGVTLGNVRTETYNDIEIDSVQTAIIVMDTKTGKPKIYTYWQALGVQTKADGYLQNAYFGSNTPKSCQTDFCILDVDANLTAEWTRENILKDYKNNFFFSRITYSDTAGYSFSASANPQFNFEIAPMMSAQAPLFKKWYSLFSEYEKENGGIINNKFLQYQEVPDSWVNRAMQLRRYFSVSDGLTYLGYNSPKIDVVLNCLETVKK